MMKRSMTQIVTVFVCLAVFAPAYGVLRPVLVVGGQDGSVSVVDASGQTMASTNYNQTAIAQIDFIDVNRDGRLEVLVTNLEVADKSTRCYRLPRLEREWDTSHPTSFGALGHDAWGARIWSGDFDKDGQLELVIPHNYQGRTIIQVFRAADGTRKAAMPQDRDWLPAVYLDVVDCTWRLVAENNPDPFTHYLYNYDLGTGTLPQKWENTSVNTWKLGAVGRSMCDGEPRIWGGWYGRTLYVVDRNGRTLWAKSFGGGYEADGYYGGDLRGDGIEVILVGGVYDTSRVRLDAARLCDGCVLWTFEDTTVTWGLHVMAVRDVNGDGAKEIFVATPGGYGRNPKYQCINGLDGTRLWQQQYPDNTSMFDHARFVDVDGDGVEELLVAVGNTLEARNARTGQLVRTYPFTNVVTAFEVAKVERPGDPADFDDDGDVDLVDFVYFQEGFNGPNRPSRNRAPLVNAGPDQDVPCAGCTVFLDGTVKDDNLPDPPGVVTGTWSKESGPGDVTFADLHALHTTAVFSTPGTYVVKLTASDSVLKRADTMVIRVGGRRGGGNLVVAQGSQVRALAMTDRTERWATDAGFNVTNLIVVPDGGGSVVLASDGTQVATFDGRTGSKLWSRAGELSLQANDVYHQIYTDRLRFPYGPPNLGGSCSPDILILSNTAAPRTTYLVDSRTGTIIWSRTEATDTRGFQFLATAQGSYDVIFASESADMLRVDGATGKQVIWRRSLQRRWGIPVPDVSGDGSYDLLAAPSYYDPMVRMLNGATGADVWALNYCSFDVLGAMVIEGASGCDVIVSAQGACAGGIRRYHGRDRSVVWDCSPTYNNNTLQGFLRRTNGLTVLSGWRHHGVAIALDAATGALLWDSVPAANGDFAGIGLPDLTGDGNDDLLAFNEGSCRLYDGVTGSEQAWFTPIQATAVAFDAAGARVQ